MQIAAKCALSIATTLTLCAAAVPAWADSTSSAASASSTSIGSSSTSIEKSSNSSSTKDQVKQGKYTVVEMTAMLDRPDMLRLRLQALPAMPSPTQAANEADTASTPSQTANTEFYLQLPRQTAEREHLTVGQVVAAGHRPYGLAFSVVSDAGAKHAFFLVLDDAWFSELESRPLGV